MAFPPHWCRFQQQFNISLITQAEFQAPLKKNKASADKSRCPQLKSPVWVCVAGPTLQLSLANSRLVLWQDALLERTGGPWGLPVWGLSLPGSVPSAGGTFTSPIWDTVGVVAAPSRPMAKLPSLPPFPPSMPDIPTRSHPWGRCTRAFPNPGESLGCSLWVCVRSHLAVEQHGLQGLGLTWDGAGLGMGSALA